MATFPLTCSISPPANRPEGCVSNSTPSTTTSRRHLTTFVTDADGRNGNPRSPIEPGVYQLTFHAGDYFRSQGQRLDATPFLDQIVVRFGVGDATRHYHVPLLLGPYGYSTYRGS